jgi:hypothetical protein
MGCGATVEPKQFRTAFSADNVVVDPELFFPSRIAAEASKLQSGNLRNARSSA